MEKSLSTDQIINKILLHLPVKPLIRFRSVCKSWRSLINDPIFIDAHRKKMEIVSDNLRLFQIVYQLYPNEGLRSWCYAGSPSNELIHPGFPIMNTKPCTYELVGSCNGLICFLTNFLHGKKEINLWNPSLRKYRTVPASTFSPERQRHAPSYGFGFDGSNDHKMVKVTYIDDRILKKPIVEVYSLKQDSWKTIGDCFPSQYYYVRGVTVFFNGCIHWLTQREYGKIRPRRLPIVSFDVVKEVFQEFWLPNPTEREANCISPLHGSLCVCAKSTSPIDTILDIEVWLMKEYAMEETWTKLYVTRLDEELSGPIIPLRVLDHFAEAIVYINKNVFLYDHENEEFEDFGIWANGIGVPYVTSFMESLVWVEPIIVETTRIKEEVNFTIERMEIENAKLESTTSKKETKEVGAKQDGNCVIL
ncbi:F-box/kelch-repeat protein At3g23880-like [Lycium ferocissimum]|uniref:F-box/kelch-repeat protein At3g23880-like n=1 Tax=Lycium ferocissimum TaxID=112874 RepID=UPI002815E771|nr:F-box/kelch-repeat protein At3g23880-like [Lycium ferocissimum]